MEKWKYKRIRITVPLGCEGELFEEWAIDRLNRQGADGWEVCTLREDLQAWTALLKRKVA
jgi:hypothetical protein